MIACVSTFFFKKLGGKFLLLLVITNLLLLYTYMANNIGGELCYINETIGF